MATDIYALGAILYELLTGRPPFKAESALETLYQVVAHEQVAPSRLRPKLPRALETLCLKCLHKEPSHRYASAAALAEDLRRFLENRSIKARRSSVVERSHRWCRRNPAVASLGAASVLAMVIGTAVSTWQMFRARRAESEMRSVLGFVEHRVLSAARPDGLGRTVTLRQAIDAALPAVAQEFAGQPLVEARIRQTLGTSYYQLGDPARAAEQYEASRALYARHRGPGDPDTLLSMSNLANCYSVLGRRAEALKLREQTLALRKTRLGPDHPDTLDSMHNLANSYFELGRLAESLELREQTLALRKARFGPDHPDTLTSMCNLAVSYNALGRRAEALKLHEATLELMKAKLGPDHPDTLQNMNNLAVTYARLGRQDEALKLREATLALMKAKLGPDHPDTLGSMHNLANSYRALGRKHEALKLYEATLALRRSKLGSDHPDTLRSMNNLANSYQALGRQDEALKLHEATLALHVSKLGSDHPNTLLSRLLVASGLVRLGRGAEAAADCRRAAETWEKRGGSDANSLYNATCFRAVTAAALRAADTSPAGTGQAEAEADRALVWLERAVAAGYRDAANMTEDHDLDALRHRADFKELLARLSAARPK